MDQSEMTVAEAKAYLGISHGTMASLINSGRLKTRQDPLDRRRKLVKTSEIKKLKEQSSK